MSEIRLGQIELMLIHRFVIAFEGIAADLRKAARPTKPVEPEQRSSASLYSEEQVRGACADAGVSGARTAEVAAHLRKLVRGQ